MQCGLCYRRVRMSRPVCPHGPQSGQHIKRNRSRRGVAVVELAFLVPLIALLLVTVVDVGRVFYFSLTLQNCARAGAIYASDPFLVNESPFADVEEAALSDATNIRPSPKISTSYGFDSDGRQFVQVTAAYTFRSITQFPGIPHRMKLTRTVRMYISAITPDVN